MSEKLMTVHLVSIKSHLCKTLVSGLSIQYNWSIVNVSIHLYFITLANVQQLVRAI